MKSLKPADRWIFDYRDIACWGVGSLILILVDQAARRDD